MKNISQDELKRVQLRILEDFDSVCRKNEIKYSMAAGSLIGAIRHKGYIPWDDDIDVMMTRSEFIKLTKLFQDDRYKLLTPYTDRLYPYPFAKIIDTSTVMKENMKEAYEGMGVYIDVFIFDERPTDESFLFIRFLKCLQTLKTLEDSNDRRMTRRILLKILQLFLKPIRINSLSRTIDKKAQKWIGTGGLYSLIVWANDLNIIFTREEMEDVINWDFEKQTCLVSSHYDSVLKKRYGDYMQLPPIDERIPKHNFEAYYKGE